MTRTLIITLGSTPQLVTETLYALVAGEGWIPDRIILCTTASSRTRFERGAKGRNPPHDDTAALLGPQGRLAACIASLGLAARAPGIEVIVPRLPDGSEIDDIRSPGEVTAFAERFLEVARRETANPGSAVHVSLAGGRKTMSYIAGLALSLVARSQDRLSHVLVAPEAFERRPAFWWPTQSDPAESMDADNTPWRARDAVVELHDVPMVRLRAFEVPAADTDFEEAVSLANAVLSDTTDLVFDAPARTLSVGPVSFTFSTDVHAALYHLALLGHVEDWACLQAAGFSWDVLCSGRDDDGAMIFSDRFFPCLRLAYQRSGEGRSPEDAHDRAAEMVAERAGDMKAIQAWLSSELSRLRSELKQAFPSTLHARLVPDRGLTLGWARDRVRLV
jgi:CRISPR-associated protein (TIGR02584 family)